MGEQAKAEPTAALLGVRSDVVPALRRALRPLMAYELALKLIALFLLGPLGAALVNALIALSGEPSVANTQLLAFGLSPLGISTALVAGSVLLATAFIERAGVAVILMSSLRGRPVTAWQALCLAFRNTRDLAGVAILQVLLALLAAVPFAVLGWLTYTLVLSGGDINFYLADRPPAFFVAAGIGAFLALVAAGALTALYVRWFFAVPVCLFEGRRFGGALRGSAALVHGRGWRTLGILVVWEVGRLACGALFLFILVLANDAVAAVLAHYTRGVLWCVAALLFVDVILAQAASALDTLGLCLLTVVLYENARRRTQALPARQLLELGTGPGDSPLVQRRRSWAVAGLVVLALFLTGWHCAALVRTFTTRKAVAVTAHRAGGHGVPENTLAALRKGIASGAAFAEIDVQETADGVIVVVHDQDLRRLAVDDERRTVAKLTWAELKALDIGTKKGSAFAGERVATLEEFIEAARGRIKLNIELKYYGRPGERLAREVVRILDRQDFITQAVVTSLSHEALAQVRRLDRRIQTGFIVAFQVGDLTRLDVDFLSINKKLAKPDLLARAAKHGLGVHVWTVDQRPEMVRLLDRGVDNLISDEPELAVEVVNWYQDLSDLELFLLRFRDWLRG